MQVKARLRYLRIAPRKVRLVADLIRGKSIQKVQNLLDFSIKKAAGSFKNLLNQAIANAKNNLQLEEKTLRIVKVAVDEGPKLKRWRARSKGRTGNIQKKTSHITLILEGEKDRKVEKEITGQKMDKIESNEEAKKIKSSKFKKQKAKSSKSQLKKAGGKVQKVFRRKSF